LSALQVFAALLLKLTLVEELLLDLSKALTHLHCRHRAGNVADSWGRERR
jgi:hypothetical protein